MLSNAQVQKIYAMGSKLGMVGSKNHSDDMLHELVYNLTGKGSVRSLSSDEYKAVVSELAVRLKIEQLAPTAPPQHPRKKQHKSTAKGMSEGQQRKVWYLMYQLIGCDLKPVTATKGERLCGIIKKELHIDCIPAEPFAWMGFEDGNRLIEILKKYVKSAERRAMRGG